jgi:hypothetical protein
MSPPVLNGPITSLAKSNSTGIVYVSNDCGACQ